jgi:hypothetical protein
VGRGASGRSGSCETTRSTARRPCPRLACFVCAAVSKPAATASAGTSVLRPRRRAGSAATDMSACVDARACKVLCTAAPDVTEEEPLTLLTDATRQGLRNVPPLPRQRTVGASRRHTCPALKTAVPAVMLWLTLYDCRLCSPDVYLYLSISAVNAASHQRPFIRG